MTTPTENLWDGVERRKFPPQPPAQNADVWRYVIDQFESLNVKLNALHIDMVGHKAELAHIQRDVDDIKRGFPKQNDGSRDYDGHFDYHSMLIDKSKTWNEIWIDVRKKVFGGVAWATIIWVSYVIWEAVKNEVKK